MPRKLTKSSSLPTAREIRFRDRNDTQQQYQSSQQIDSLRSSSNLTSRLPTVSPNMTSPKLEPSPPQIMSSRLTTPEILLQTDDQKASDSSDLSSAPADLGETPFGLISPEKRMSNPRIIGDGSPIRRSSRKRNASTRANDAEAPEADLLAKKRKISSLDENAPSSSTSNDKIDNSSPSSGQQSGDSASPEIKSGDDIDNSPASTPSNDLSPIRDNIQTKSDEEKRIKSAKEKRERRLQAQFQRGLQQQLADRAIDLERWPELEANKLTFYGADGRTIYTHAHSTTPQSPSPTKKDVKTNGKTNKANNNTRSRIAKGRVPIPNRGRGESPDPPQKHTSTEEELNIIKALRKRQAELRHFFNTVGGQQRDILEQLATRDLNKMMKKAKAHKQVPEYDEIVEDLDDRRYQAEELIRKEFEIKKADALLKIQCETEVIEQQYRLRVEEAREEHTRGAAGDIALLKQAHASKGDDNHTDDGSEADYFPQYHECPEPDARVRGYTSTRITDERPFTIHLPSFDELANRDVIEDEVTGPILKSINTEREQQKEEFDRKNAERRAEVDRKKTQTLAALSDEAIKELEQMKGYLIPRPLRAVDDQPYGLSRLADASEYMRNTHPHQQYMYIPLPEGSKFPVEALDVGTTPSRTFLFPQTQPLFPSQNNHTAQQASSMPPASLPGPPSVPQLVRESSARSTQSTLGSFGRPVQQVNHESSRWSTTQNFPESSVRSMPQSSESTSRSAGIPPTGPHRHLAIKPYYPGRPSRPVSPDSSRRHGSFRNLAPQPHPLPIPPPQPQQQQPPTPTHHLQMPQQFTFVTPQQPPQSAQYVVPAPPQHAPHHHHSNNTHHHRHTSSNHTTNNNTTINGISHPTTGNTNTNARSRSTSIHTNTSTTNLSSQQGKIPMQFVNSTPESARMKAQAAAAAAAAQQQQLVNGNLAALNANGPNGSGGNGGGNGNGGGGGAKGRTLLPKPGMG